VLLVFDRHDVYLYRGSQGTFVLIGGGRFANALSHAGRLTFTKIPSLPHFYLTTTDLGSWNAASGWNLIKKR